MHLMTFEPTGDTCALLRGGEGGRGRGREGEGGGGEEAGEERKKLMKHEQGHI